jgi:subtilisin-like proprotein convertase family protein
VIDTRPGNRGVIAGGWSLNYPTAFSGSSPGVAIPSLGPAGTYPIQFDASQMTSDSLVRRVFLTLRIQHDYPDDLRIVLESPAGTKVAVMANAGGGTPVNTTLVFDDFGGALVPDEGPITAFPRYLPGSVYETPLVSLPPPAPPAPYGSRFSAFNGQVVAGIWKLWVYDDSAPTEGTITAGLTVTTDRVPLFSIHLPTAAATYTTDQPFVPIQAEVQDVDSRTT